MVKEYIPLGETINGIKIVQRTNRHRAGSREYITECTLCGRREFRTARNIVHASIYCSCTPRGKSETEILVFKI